MNSGILADPRPGGHFDYRQAPPHIVERVERLAKMSDEEKIELTDSGRYLVRYSNPPAGQHSHAMDKLHEALEKAVQAHFRFLLDQSYMVTPDKDFGQLIDENTFLYRPSRMGDGVEILGVPEIKQRWGIERPEQVIDVLTRERLVPDDLRRGLEHRGKAVQRPVLVVNRATQKRLRDREVDSRVTVSDSEVEAVAAYLWAAAHQKP
jgi:hypothetical protein